MFFSVKMVPQTAIFIFLFGGPGGGGGCFPRRLHLSKPRDSSWSAAGRAFRFFSRPKFGSFFFLGGGQVCCQSIARFLKRGGNPLDKIWCTSLVQLSLDAGYDREEGSTFRLECFVWMAGLLNPRSSPETYDMYIFFSCVISRRVPRPWGFFFPPVAVMFFL